VAISGYTYKSPDGLAWTKLPVESLPDAGLHWGGGQYVAVGGGGGTNSPRLVSTSPDGNTWTARGAPPGGALRSVVWTGTQYVAVGDGGSIVTSRDGGSWEERWPPTTVDLNGVAWNGRVLVAVGATEEGRAVTLTSIDGATWTKELSPTTSYGLNAVAWSGSHFVAVGNYGEVLRRSCGAGTIGPAFYVPAAAHAPGLGGANWRSTVEVFNRGSLQARYTVSLLKRDQSNTAPERRSFVLEPTRSARYEDMLWSVFGFEGAAALRFEIEQGTTLITSRTFNDTASGTYGQFVQGLPEASAIAYGETGALIQLSQSTRTDRGFRTNLGMVNITPATLSVQVDLFGSSGTQFGSLTYALRPYEYRQVNEIFKQVTQSDLADGYALVTTTTPGGKFFAYASVIDNRSGDGVHIPAL